MDLFLFNDTPSLYVSGPTKDIADGGRTERDPWGAWHVSNGHYRQRKSCFNVIMDFNEVGARDSSFSDLVQRI